MIDKGRCLERDIIQALKLAAEALEIAEIRGVPFTYIKPPEEWNLSGVGEKGTTNWWISTSDLAKKLKSLVAEIESRYESSDESDL